MSWFRSSRRRLKEREAGPEGAPEAVGEPEGNGGAPALPRSEVVGRPLADLHELAREHGVPRYRLLRKEELIGALAGDDPMPVGVAEEPAPPAAPAVAVSDERSISVELLEAVQRLVHQLSPNASAPGASDLEEIVSSPMTRLLVARENGEIVGMLTLVVYRIPTGVCAWIEDVVVDEGARERGVGQALTREAMRIATDARARTVDLTSRRERQAANRMYRKLGFKQRDTNIYRFEP
jgi:ribosomal protein S18 acetylase RimI-like enzyme